MPHRYGTAISLVAFSTVSAGFAITGVGSGCSSLSRDGADGEHVESTSQPVAPPSPLPAPEVLTSHNDNYRRGAQTNERILTPLTVPYLQKIGALNVDGIITAQPLVMHDLMVNNDSAQIQDALVVVTNQGSIYVVNAGTLAPLYPSTPPGTFPANPANPFPVEQRVIVGSGIGGILSTPVIDTSTSTLYVVDVNSTGPSNVTYWLLAYDLTAMNQEPMKTAISGTCKGTNEQFQTLNSFEGGPLQLQQIQRPALLLDHGHIYIAFGGNALGASTFFREQVRYNGWVFAYNTKQNGLTSAGSPYCVTKTANEGLLGRGAIWQFGAGPAADDAGNVFAATGNGNMVSALDDANAFVRLPGTTWGTWNGQPWKYRDPDALFLARNDVDLGSTGPVVLPGSFVLGAGKQGLFTVLNTSMGLFTPRIRAAWHQWAPMLGNPKAGFPDNPEGDPNVKDCTAIHCNDAGVPTWSSPVRACCGPGSLEAAADQASNCNPPNGYSQPDDACTKAVQYGYAHIHGQPTYWNGRLYWWPEKDFPRYTTWSASTGPGSISNTGSRVSDDLADRAPNNPDGGVAGMPGGLTSVSADGTEWGVLWANVPADGGFPPAAAYLKAFDIRGTTPKSHIFQTTISSVSPYTFPTIANGYVYVAGRNGVVSVFSTRPPKNPVWDLLPGGATSVASGWILGGNAVGTNGDYGVWRFDPTLNPPNWVSVPGGGVAITVDLHGTPWLVNNAGRIYKWDGSVFQAFGSSAFVAKSVASGVNDFETWAIRASDGAIFQWTSSGWTQRGQTGATGTKIAIRSVPDSQCQDHLPMVTGTGGDLSIYKYTHTSSCTSGLFEYSNGGGVDIATDFTLNNGIVYRWDSQVGWQIYSSVPAGSNKIGAWANGVYVLSTSNSQVRLARSGL
jgi:hypothetical protein